MTDPTYPLFIFDGFDLLIISSPQMLPVYVERLDCRSDDEEVFDSTGRRVRFAAIASGIFGLVGSRIVAKLDVTEPTSLERLIEKLRTFLCAVGDPRADDPECDLACLMEACRKQVV